MKLIFICLLLAGTKCWAFPVEDLNGTWSACVEDGDQTEEIVFQFENGLFKDHQVYWTQKGCQGTRVSDDWYNGTFIFGGANAIRPDLTDFDLIWNNGNDHGYGTTKLQDHETLCISATLGRTADTRHTDVICSWTRE